MEEAAAQVLPLDLLACPACRGALQAQAAALLCAACKREFPLEDGVPNFVCNP